MERTANDERQIISSVNMRAGLYLALRFLAIRQAFAGDTSPEAFVEWVRELTGEDLSGLVEYARRAERGRKMPKAPTTMGVQDGLKR